MVLAFATAALVLIGALPVTAGDTTCVGPLTGVHDNVVVPSGANCTLIAAQVKGNVKVLPNGSLHTVSLGALRTMIGGNVQGDHSRMVLLQFETQVGGDVQIIGGAPGTVSGFDIRVVVRGSAQIEGNAGVTFVDAAQVGGNLTVLKNTGRLEIEFNTVGGNIKVEDNAVPAGGMSVLGNQVTGNLQVFKNTGAGAKQVIVNTVGEALQCFENDPPFVGGPNTAKDKQGQCF